MARRKDSILEAFDEYLSRQYERDDTARVKNTKPNGIITAIREKIGIEREFDLPAGVVKVDMDTIKDSRQLVEFYKKHETDKNNPLVYHVKKFLNSKYPDDAEWAKELDQRIHDHGHKHAPMVDVLVHKEHFKPKSTGRSEGKGSGDAIKIEDDYDRFGVICEFLGKEKQEVDGAIKELRTANKALREAQRQAAASGGGETTDVREKIEAVNKARLILSNLNQKFGDFENKHKDNREYSNRFFVKLLQVMSDGCTITGDASVRSRIQKMQAELRLAPEKGVDKRFRERIGDLLLIILIDIKMFFADAAVYIKEHCKSKSKQKPASR